MSVIYHRLSSELKEQLDRVPSARDGRIHYKPCQVTLKDGRVLPRVYVQEAVTWSEFWGEAPGPMRLLFLDPLTILRIMESPHRLPVKFAEELYRAGESAMGGCIFTVVFKDGSRQVYATGNAVDFLPYPKDKSTDDIVSVIPHEGRMERNRLRGLDYTICLYSEEASAGSP